MTQKVTALRVDPSRIIQLKSGEQGQGPVIYWMSRDQRAQDNWALVHAQDLALAAQAPLVVAFCLAPAFLGATARQYDFMLTGLEQAATQLAALNIPLVLLLGEPQDTLLKLTRGTKAGAMVTDFDPLRIKRTWKRQVCAKVHIPVWEVDAHNIVPCWMASNKQEYGARTIRPKIHRLLPDSLVPIPKLVPHPFRFSSPLSQPDWTLARAFVRPDERVQLPKGMMPGSQAGLKCLQTFILNGLSQYSQGRNDPNKKALSGLSPYLHFGQVAAQRVALEVQAARWPSNQPDNTADFLEQLIVRRELADNFCWYNEHYASLEGAPNWARQTLEKHARDPRIYQYSSNEFEQAQTHDDLWNAAQNELTQTGTMHGYLRMYWAKKILEWTPHPTQALEIGIRLNDRYQLDGRDPNGYVGLMWSICGVHDRPWPERSIFGTIRSMTLGGCRKKFDVDAYVRTWKKETRGLNSHPRK